MGKEQLGTVQRGAMTDQLNLRVKIKNEGIEVSWWKEGRIKERYDKSQCV